MNLKYSHTFRKIYFRNQKYRRIKCAEFAKYEIKYNKKSCKSKYLIKVINHTTSFN